MVTVIVLTFIIGYLAIVFEHPLKLDKTVPALVMGALCWAFLSLGGLGGELIDHHGHALGEGGMNTALLHHLGKIAEILVFLIGAMTVVELVDMHDGFSVITGRINTRKKTTLLWIVMILSFFLSAFLDNLTCTIVMVSLLKKILKNKEERLYFASLVVIAANAGGAWSPIGDVTTTMLWIGDRISTVNMIVLIVLPSIVCAVIPTFIFSRLAIMKGEIDPIVSEEAERSEREKRNSVIMLSAGLLGLMFVPIFKTVTHLPPYVGMMLVLGVVWFISERLHPEEATMGHGHLAGAKHALSRIDTSSILFFLGILLTVASLESLGVLSSFAASLDTFLPARAPFAMGMTGGDVVMILLGFGSAIVDNVPLVAAAMGMYSPTDFPLDDKLWHFLAYTAGTGGSALIIGSAAGVAAMGMEQIDFMWYMRKISWVAIVGFLAGAVVFLLLYPALSGMLPPIEAAKGVVAPAH
jgi:Na+/H+ antiporter NhaD/arsenite permease-like protein